MVTNGTLPDFSVVSGTTIYELLWVREDETIDLIEEAYRLYGRGETTDPPSYFLQFPDKPSARIIALPAAVRGATPVDGLKWVSSYPTNLRYSLPRASALLMLNDVTTGYPVACLEGSIISAARTAASAAVALRHLSRFIGRPTSVGFVGAGLIARYLYAYLSRPGQRFARVGVHDLSVEYADAFAAQAAAMPGSGKVQTYTNPAELLRSHDLIVFATSAAHPYVMDPTLFAHNPIVLHVSLRDLNPAVILSSTNIVDDIDHVLNADTSVHLTEKLIGNRDFISATLCDLINGKFVAPLDRPTVFSPFGLGILDLVVGYEVYRRAAEAGLLKTIDGFFYDMDRHHPPAGERS